MLLTLKDVGKELQINSRSVLYMIERGELASIRISERNIRVHPDDLETYIRDKQKEATQKCKQLRTPKQADTNSDSLIQAANASNSRQKRISQRALRNVRQIK